MQRAGQTCVPVKSGKIMSDDILGRSLGRYHVLEKLGEGGMAAVYKAFDTRLERNVAIKVILPHHEHSDEFLIRFHREARTLANLAHPNILKVFDYGEIDNHPYLVMEFIDGGTLKDWLFGRPTSWQKAVQLLARVARALEAAHASGVIHRDVKPANILMVNGTEPLLSDFGIAKLIEGHEETTDLTGTGVGIGTPVYMAPEQGDGMADERSDIYSLGVILYQMVTGRLPFEADTPLSVMLKKMVDPLPRPTDYVPDLPVYVENVLIKALATDPQNRYRHMSEFSEALERLTSKADTIETIVTEAATEIMSDQARSDVSPIPELPGGKDSTRWPPWTFPAGVLLSVAFVAFLLLRNFFLLPETGSISVTATRPPERLVERTPTEPEANPTPKTATTPTPRVTPTITGGGKWIAFNSRMDGDADIYLMDTNGENVTKLTSSSAHDLYASWSPEGTHIVYQTNDGGDHEIAIIEISSKRVTPVTENTCEDWAPTWSPTGEWIAFYSTCDGDRNIYKIRPDGTGRTQLTSTSGSNSWFPSWSPDGMKLTFTSNRSGRYRIYTINADGSNLRELAEGCISYFSPDGEQILYGVYCNDTDDLFIMNADGSHPTPVTMGHECKNAAWSPDGTQIVFQLSKTTMEGPFALYRMYLDKPDKEDWILLTDYDVNGGSPAWQP